jgi:uncharacterized OsmC-like protein
MQTTISILNGFNLERMWENLQAFTTQPELARFRFRVNNQWIVGGYNQSVIKDFYGAGKEDTSRETPFIIANDEPEVLLGNNYAPKPAEFLLHALAGCLTTTLAYHASARGYEIKKLQTSVEGNLDMRGFLGIDSPVRKGSNSIKIVFDIEGDFSEEEKEELLKLTASSPVLDMISNPVPVKIYQKEKVNAVAIDC